jgi:hypothetical protein
LRTAIPTALIVGSVLCAVNQGATLLAGQATAGTWVRMAINYVVPFLVASIGYLSAHHIRRRELQSPANRDPEKGVGQTGREGC